MSIIDHFLVVGSAYYMPSWIEKYRHEIPSYWKICPINNAIKLFKNDPKLIPYVWYSTAEFIPTHVSKEGQFDFKDYLGDNQNIPMCFGTFLAHPRKYFFYNKVEGNLFSSTVIDILNRNITQGILPTVYVIGCDCIYGENSHFYGNGSKDPIRFGEEALKNTLNEIMNIYKEEGGKIINLSESEKTLLPFERQICSTIIHSKT